jgi:lipopolysaccharide/colanic/teichoic acid biosynthesis glycosyltransferase
MTTKVPAMETTAPATPAVGASDDQSRALVSTSKRVLDITAAACLIVMFSPIWLVAAILIRVTSPGPVIFRQVRLGAGGRPFVLYKLRTMHYGVPEDAHRAFVTRLIKEEANAARLGEHGPVYKLAGDPRITRIGRVLRKLSLDEIPQLINVLLGDMSLVGPRPPLPYEVAEYEPWQFRRLAARPGITGLWQVSGRNRLTHREMCELDIKYVDDWSLLLDLKVIVRTPWVMLVDGGGAS